MEAQDKLMTRRQKAAAGASRKEGHNRHNMRGQKLYRPLSPGGGWTEKSLYNIYADLARENLTAGRYFDSIVVSSVGYDVLMDVLLDRMRLHDHKLTTPERREAMRKIETHMGLSAGEILRALKTNDILPSRLFRALELFNKARNKVIHPIRRPRRRHSNGSTHHVLSLKADAVIPRKAKKEEAEWYYRYFCHIIDLSGGESPRRSERASRIYPSFSDLVRQLPEKRRLAKSPKTDDRT